MVSEYIIPIYHCIPEYPTIGVLNWTRLKARLTSQPTYLEECNIPDEDIDKIQQGIERYDEEFLRTAVDDYLKTCQVPKGNIRKYTEAIFGTVIQLIDLLFADLSSLGSVYGC